MVASTRAILGDGGEGVMTRKPNSEYEKGRSSSLIKFKASRADREALVVGQEPDGSFQLKLPEGTIFSARVPDLVSSEVQPTLGDIVTFSYEKYSRNVIPVKPKIYRIRDDVAWRDVINSFASSASDHSLHESQRAGLPFSRYPMGYWKIQKGKNTRNFFERFAKSKQMDPVQPETWYSISKEDILSVKGGPTVLNQYGGSVVRALLDVFPDIGLDVTKFHRILKAYWDKKEHRRRFFEKFASKFEFDSLVSENWYSVSRRSVERYKSGRTVLAYYKGSLAKALADLFPEIKFDPKKFQYLSKPKEERKDWKSEEDSHRRFFDSFAAKFKFDSLVSNNWYTVEISDIAKEGGQALLNKYYQGSLIRALQQNYPSLSFDIQKFKMVPRSYWDDLPNRKSFFEKYAENFKFDPEVPHNWYSVTAQDVLKIKGGGTILKYYNNSLATTLTSLFPDIGLDKSKFGKAPQNYWTNKENRRNFFEKVAETQGFNANIRANWDQVTARFLYRFKGGKSVLSYYNNSVTKAIVDLFD